MDAERPSERRLVTCLFLDIAAKGARVAGAVASAIREEEAGGGRGHGALRQLGCHGLSELIAFRPAARR